MGMTESASSPPDAGGGITELAKRVRRLEAQRATLTDAVEALARALESSPADEPANHHIEQAARHAHELLLLSKTEPIPGDGPGGDSTSS